MADLGRRALMRQAVTAALLLSAPAVGCTARGDGASEDGRGAGNRPQSPPSTAARKPDRTGPVLAVKIDNVARARPQTGLEAADLVYVEQVEGGLSRLLAVYATKLPPVVGPVRSARESDLELLRQFDRPVLAFSGAQRKLLPLIDTAPLSAETPERRPDAYFRAAGRPAPHNLYLRPERLLASAPGADALATGLRHGPAPAGGRARTSHTVGYPAARFTFTWSARRHGWQVTMDGRTAVTADGTPLTPATVVVQQVTVRRSALHDALGSPTPYTETVGSGTAQVLRDGRIHDVTWKRARATDVTEFTAADGTPVHIAPGQVWVVLTGR